MLQGTPRTGATARHRDGSVLTFNGRDWVQTTPPRAPGSSGRGGVTPQDRNQLGNMRDQAVAAGELERTYSRVGEANQRLQPGPWRGRFLDAAIPNAGGGVMDTLGATLIGGPARLIGAITPQEVNDYQTIEGARSEGVLQRQIEQRGPQTESDAARMAMTELGVGNTLERNRNVINQGLARTQRAQARAAYYSQWAARFGGLSGTRNSRGQTVNEAWEQFGPAYTRRFVGLRGSQQRQPTRRPGATIRRIR